MATEYINIIVRENGSRVVKRNLDMIGRQAITTNSAVSILSRSLLGLTGGLSVAIGIQRFVSTLAEFSQALSTVRAITGATTESFRPLEAEIKRLGATTRFTSTQAAEGAQFLARAGFNAEQTTAALAGTLTLAQAGALDFASAADIATNVLTAFQLNVSQTGAVVDVLAFAANRSNTNVQQLGDALKFVAPIAGGLNISLEATVAAISALSDAGLQGSIAGTGLRRIMTELESTSASNLRTLARLGLTQEDVRPSTIGLANAIERLRDAGLTAGEAMRFFGQRGGPAFVNLSNQIPKVREMEESLRSSGGFAAELARVMDDNLNGAILAVRSAIEALVIAIGDSGAFTFLTVTFRALAAVIRFVASNIEIFMVALQGLLAIKAVDFIANLIARNRELATAIAAGNATLLTSVEVENAKAASSLRAAQASSVAAAAKVRELQTGVVELQQNRALLLQQQASITIDNQRRIARDALTGRFIAYNAAVAQNIRTNIALQRTEQALLATKGQLTGAITAQTAATNALSAAQTRQAGAAAAANTLTARLSRTFPVLAGGIGVAGRALAGLGTLIAANPVGAIIVAVAAATAALWHFSDRIGVADDGVVTLRDTGIAAFQLIGEALAPLTSAISEGFSAALEFVSEKWQQFKDFVGNIIMGLLGIWKTMINTYIGLWVGLVNSVIKAWDILPDALLDIGKMAINGLVTVVEGGINGILEAIQGLLTFIGSAAELVGRENPFSNLLDGFRVDLSEWRQETSGAAREVGQILNEEFSNALSVDYIGDAWTAVLERARTIAAERIRRLAEESYSGDPGDGDGAGSGSGSGAGTKTFADFVREMTVQNELLRVSAAEREKLSAIINIENQLKRQLTQTERELIMELLNENEVLTRAAQIYEDIHGPAYQYQLTLEALNELLREGRINQDQFNESVRRGRIEFLNTQNDMLSGFERGFLKILEKTQDLATQTEQIITNAFDGMSSAIADLVVTGKADFASLIQSINKQIVQLVVSQAFQMLFGSTGIGGGGGNIFGSLFSGLRGLLGFQNGGSFTVGQGGASLAPLPGNDNRLVAFRAQDGEHVEITPRGQQPGGTTQNINVTFNISTPDVQGFRNSEGQLATRAARMISRAGRNQ